MFEAWLLVFVILYNRHAIRYPLIETHIMLSEVLYIWILQASQRHAWTGVKTHLVDSWNKFQQHVQFIFDGYLKEKDETIEISY